MAAAKKKKKHNNIKGNKNIDRNIKNEFDKDLFNNNLLYQSSTIDLSILLNI